MRIRVKRQTFLLCAAGRRGLERDPARRGRQQPTQPLVPAGPILTNPGARYSLDYGTQFHTNPGGKYVFRGQTSKFHTNPAANTSIPATSRRRRVGHGRTIGGDRRRVITRPVIGVRVVVAVSRRHEDAADVLERGRRAVTQIAVALGCRRGCGDKRSAKNCEKRA